MAAFLDAAVREGSLISVLPLNVALDYGILAECCDIRAISHI